MQRKASSSTALPFLRQGYHRDVHEILAASAKPCQSQFKIINLAAYLKVEIRAVNEKKKDGGSPGNEEDITIVVNVFILNQ